jgi:hypothetical protein
MVNNIRLINPNMVRVGSYFYSFNEETDVMIQKADDGTLAFSYPLDTTIGSEVTSLEHDGESFWTQENIDDGDADAGFRIRRWLIENFVMVLQQTFLFDTDSNDTFESEAFTVEHYEAVFTSGAVENTTTFTVSFETDIFDLITPGTKLFLGPSTKVGFVGETESVTVTSTGPGKLITVSAPLTNGFVSTDDLVFTKNLWFFNEHFQKTLNVGALYKVNALDGSILSRDQSGAYIGINATTFHELDSFTGDLATNNKPYLVFIRTTNLLFLNVNDSNLTIELSSVQNNLSADTVEVFDVSDMGIEGETIFRLQKKFNINGSESTSSTFNYQLATFVPFPIAIALTAEPAILPADSGASSSIITATVTDQYNLPYVTSPAATIVFTTSGGGTGSSISPTGSQNLDPNGQAEATYFTGDAAGLVTISATVTIN